MFRRKTIPNVPSDEKKKSGSVSKPAVNECPKAPAGPVKKKGRFKWPFGGSGSSRRCSAPDAKSKSLDSGGIDQLIGGVKKTSAGNQIKATEDKILGDVGLNLENQDYFHGILPRAEIDELLKTNGDFIVRESQKVDDIQIVLSMYWDGPKHFIFRTNIDGNFRLEGDMFPSVPALIHHYFYNKVPVSKHSMALLLRPVKREKWQLSNDDIVLGKMLGKGNFGEVYRGVYKDPDTPGTSVDVAVKTANEEMPENEKKLFLREARIMRRYKHPNIVQLVGVCATRAPMMIVLELVSGGSLIEYLQKSRTNSGTAADLKEKAKFCKEAATGMEYLSSQGCLHRDLAARNCLLGDDNTLKISDFGMSREGDTYNIQTSKCMPIKWTAIEVLESGHFTGKADVWAFGILMYEIFSDGGIPYPTITNRDVIPWIQKGNRMSPPTSMPAELGTLMATCWKKNLDDRPTFSHCKTVCENVHKSLPSS